MRGNVVVRVSTSLVLLSCAAGLFLGACTANAQTIHELSYNGSSWTDANLNGATSEPYTGIGAFVTTPNDQRHVYYIDYNSYDVRQLFFNGTSWADDDLTVLSGASVGADGSVAVSGFSVGNYQYVYYIGAEEDVHQLLYNNSRWTDTNLSAAAGGPIAGSSALIVLNTSPALHVFYTDAYTGHVHQLFATNGTNWQDQDLTNVTGGTVASGSPMAGFNIGNEQYLYFIDTHNHLHQFLYNNVQWSDEDLSALTKTSAFSRSGVTALVLPGTKQLRAYVLSAKGHILQLASTNNMTWTSSDLTARAKAPLPADYYFAAYTSAPKNALHLNYIGYANPNYLSVIQLSQPTAATWGYEDLTALTNGAIPENDYANMAGFSLQSHQYLYYVGQ